MKRSRIVGFIPIRLNSKRVPGKSIKQLNGKPLLQYNLETMLQLGLDEIYVYCSSPEIIRFLPEGVTWLKRHDSLDSDDTLGIDVWRAFEKDVDAEIIVMSHATAPFIKAESIKKGLSKVCDAGYLSCCSVREIQTYCWYKNEPLNFERDQILQTQKLYPVLEETGGFYIWKKGVVEKQDSRISNHHFFLGVSEIEAIDIDYPDDFELAEAIASSLIK